MCNCKSAYPQYNNYRWQLEEAHRAYDTCEKCKDAVPVRIAEYSMNRNGEDRLWKHTVTCEHCGHMIEVKGKSGKIIRWSLWQDATH